jgi:hypothetical protein
MIRNFGLILLIAGLLLSLAAGASAQTKEGNILFMGSVALSSSGGKLHGSQTTTTFRLDPRGYYFIKDQIAIGGRLGLNTTSGGGYRTTSFLVGPDGEYFFKTQSEELLPFAGAGVFLSSTSGGGNSTTGFMLALHGGVAYMLKKNLSLFPEAEFDFESRDGHSGTAILIGMGIAGFLY